jgi:rubrerythrin
MTGMDWLSFLKIMAMEEHAARAKYQLAMDLAEDQDLKSFFAKLRDEEAFHAQFLEGEYEKLEKKLQHGSRDDSGTVAFSGSSAVLGC